MNAWKIMQPPPATYQLWLTPSVCMNCTGNVPGRFHRWAMHTAFGFRFVIHPAPRA